MGRVTCTVHLISTPDQPGKKQIYHYRREDTKGQLISKANCQAVDFPKKRTNKFAFFDLKSCYVVKSNAVRLFFLENLWLDNLLLKLTDL